MTKRNAYLHNCPQITDADSSALKDDESISGKPIPAEVVRRVDEVILEAMRYLRKERLRMVAEQQKVSRR